MVEKSMPFDSNPMKDSAGYLTIPQIRLLIDSADNDRDKLLIKTLFLSARRISELVRPYGPTVSDINFKDRLISWRILKKGIRKKDAPKREPMTIILPVNKTLIADMSDYVKKYNLRVLDYLFPFTRYHAHYLIQNVGHLAVEKYPDSFRYVDKTFIENGKPVTKHIILCGSKGIHAHVFRHSCAIALCNNPKMNMRKIQMVLQHSNPLMTQTYLRYASDELADAVNSVSVG